MLFFKRRETFNSDDSSIHDLLTVYSIFLSFFHIHWKHTYQMWKKWIWKETELWIDYGFDVFSSFFFLSILMNSHTSQRTTKSKINNFMAIFLVASLCFKILFDFLSKQNKEAIVHQQNLNKFTGICNKEGRGGNCAKNRKKWFEYSCFWRGTECHFTLRRLRFILYWVSRRYFWQTTQWIIKLFKSQFLIGKCQLKKI